MSREVIPPTKTEIEGVSGRTVRETHPAFGLIRVGRGQSGPPGTSLFDSDIAHRNLITVTVYEAIRERSLNHDHIHPTGLKDVLAEVTMSESQWASFVSSMNTGHGVPCTIQRRDGDWNIPGLPYEPRLAESMDEVRKAGEKAVEQIRESFDAVWEKPTKANLRHLKSMIDNAPSNMTFAARSLTEHAENVVQRSRADIEAMMMVEAQRLGIDPSEIGVPQLEADNK